MIGNCMRCVALVLCLLAILGCETTEQAKIRYYDAYWGSVDENGQTGWCSRKEIPAEDFTFKDCSNATPERTVVGAMCVEK